ncbi:dual specificity protein phosphatase -related [Anaeramoeba ignava]|uniref:Dual specificity protein phosphatase -related n=1 Tax=Anaeramoeba ignava TaxID=1746090 RepID=A0A9Q0RAK3_ANAIG|nr:dual specificity protein phosphatase -related [Anaeramoeba ignava]
MINNYNSFLQTDDLPQKIFNGLFIGSIDASENFKALKENEITHILQLFYSNKPPYPNDFKYLILDMQDSSQEDLSKFLPKCFEFYDSAQNSQGNLLVHCVAGVSRSGAVSTAIVMRELGLGFDQAFDLVKSKRPVIHPNVGFSQQLNHWGFKEAMKNQ